LLKTRSTGSNDPLFTFKYGYVETRIKRHVEGNGIHMNAYTFSYDENKDQLGGHVWPPEVDFAETVSSSSGINRILQGIHITADGERTDDMQWTSGIDWTEWQVYGFHWKEDGLIDFYINGEKTFSTTKKFLPEFPQYLLLRIGAGGWGAGVDDNTVFPAIQEVDWIRVYQEKQ